MDVIVLVGILMLLLGVVLLFVAPVLCLVLVGCAILSWLGVPWWGVLIILLLVSAS